ncbi:MAG: DUF2076 domain-containing protein [Microvirga sp.]
MDQQERQVISDIFRRLEQVADQPREPEAERFIADKVRQQPYAPYAMAQAIYVQEQALASLQAELERLRAEAEEARRQPQQGGFLSSLFGGNARSEPAYRDPSPAPSASPWGQARGGAPAYGAGVQGAPMQGGPMQGGSMQGGPWAGGNPMQSRGGGFLQGALSTAAGVAGGVMIANALSHAFGGGADEAAKGGAEGASNLTDQAAGAADLGQSNDNAGITDALYDDPQAGDDYSDLDSGSGDDGDWT